MAKLRIQLVKALIDLNEKFFFERKIKSYYKKIGGLSCVIDVGANKGQSIDLFLKINPKCEIFSIEANPNLYDTLTRKYRGHSNVHLFNVGISSSNGEKLFYENVLDYTSSFEQLNLDSSYLTRKANILGVDKSDIIAKSYTVDTITLDDFIARNLKEKKIDLIKIDTEGHEYQCILGLFVSKNQRVAAYIQIEQHTDDMYTLAGNAMEIESLLNKNNYFENISIQHGFGEIYEKVFKRDN